MLDQLLRTASMEVSAREREAAALCRDLLAPGTRVYINFAPGDTHHGMVAAAARLAQAGFRPVPHVAVRHLASFTQLRDYLGRAVGEAGVEQVLLIGGDIAQPVGPFGSSLQALATGVFEQSGLRRIGLAGYPEGHPRIDARALDDALLAKLALARRAGLEPYVVSQFCLEAAPIIDWLGRLRAQGIDAAVHVGLAGPTSIAALARYAVRCGIGNSIRALVGGQTSVARLLTEAGPEPVLRELAAVPALAQIAGLHFFSFGGTARTAEWLRQATPQLASAGTPGPPSRG